MYDIYVYVYVYYVLFDCLCLGVGIFSSGIWQKKLPELCSMSSNARVVFQVDGTGHICGQIYGPIPH